MAEITASMVKDLREQTGAGMMECKKALEETGGDVKKAVALLREKGTAKAVKRAGRSTKEGTIKAIVAADNRTGALVEVNIETDFAARSERFVKMADTIIATALKGRCANLEALLAAKPAGDEEAENVQTLITNNLAVIGENMGVNRCDYFEIPEGKFGSIRTYIHPPGKVGVMVQVETDSDATAKAPAVQDLAHNVCLQIAFSAPAGIDKDSIPEDLVKQECEIYRNAAIKEGKPEKILDKIVEGRLKSFYKERCLVEQNFVKDEEKTVGSLVAEVAKSVGGEIRIARFARFQLGEEAAE